MEKHMLEFFFFFFKGDIINYITMYFRAALRACLCALDWLSDDASRFCKKNPKTEAQML